jgi:hypothetical protein
MVCKEGHIRFELLRVALQPPLTSQRKSLKNRYFELKVGENFEPWLIVYYSQEDADQGAHKYRLDLTGALHCNHRLRLLCFATSDCLQLRKFIWQKTCEMGTHRAVASAFTCSRRR